jgi:hypothetical protein
MERSRYTRENEMYIVDDYFVEKIRELPTKLGLDIAKQIDRETEYLPEQEDWSQRVAGVSNVLNGPYFFLVEYIKQEGDKPVFLDCDLIESDEYLDYYLENKIIKSNDRKRNRKTIENSG